MGLLRPSCATGRLRPAVSWAAARAPGARVKIHFMDTPISVVQARLEARNAKLPPYNFYIDPETLQGFLGLFEAPSADEGAEVVVVSDFCDTHPLTEASAPGLVLNVAALQPTVAGATMNRRG